MATGPPACAASSVSKYRAFVGRLAILAVECLDLDLVPGEIRANGENALGLFHGLSSSTASSNRSASGGSLGNGAWGSA